MQAIVYTQPHRVEVREVSDPQPTNGEVLLKIDAVGICGSDMHAYHGHDPRRKPGLILGHEFAGTIISSKSNHYHTGERVTGNPLITCGVCQYCRHGRSNLCTDRSMIGMSRPGAFAQYMTIPASCLIPIPSALSSTHAALTEPAATAWHAIHLAQKTLTKPLYECQVAILGGGAIGMLTTLLLTFLRVGALTVVELNPLRRASIEKVLKGATWDTRENPLPEANFDLVIDCVGAATTRKSAFHAIAPGGTIIHIGLQDWESEIDMRKLTLAEVCLLGTYTYTHNDLSASVHALQQGVFGDLSWVEPRTLSDAPQAFEDLDHGKSASAKIVLVPDFH